MALNIQFRDQLSLLFLLVASFSFCGCGTESAKWDVAKAKNLYEAGDLTGAIELLEVAHQKVPQDDIIKLELAERYAENGQCELGIGLCNDYLEDHPNDVSGFEVRANCWLFLGKFDKALADYKRSISDHVSRNSLELNSLAYFRGLADNEIDKAVVEIQAAIENVENAARGTGVRIPMQVRTLVAAGLVSRRIGQHEEALELLDKKIEAYKGKVLRSNEILRLRITGSLRFRDRLSKAEEDGLTQLRLNLQQQKESLSAMLATRALILEDLGDHARADQDRLAVEELDFDFDKVAARFRSDLDCLKSLRVAAMFLDTRGFVLGRQNWASDKELLSMIGQPARAQLLVSNYREALEDLDLAVLAAQFEHLALESSLCNSTELPFEIIDQQKKANKRNRAVLLSHRKEVHLRGGNQEAAQKDQDLIVELGFEDSTLF